jgi:hypothetical protein
VAQQFGGRFPMQPGRFSGARFWRPHVAGPSLVGVVQVDRATQLNETAATPAFTPNPYELLVVKVATGDDAQLIGTPSGGGLTWTRRIERTPAGSAAGALIATAVVPAVSPGSMTVSTVFSGTASAHTVVVERWANAALAGTPATALAVNTTTTGTTIATVGAYSVVTWLDGDFNAVAPGTPVYIPGGYQSGIAASPPFLTAYFAYQYALVAGTQTFGVSAPSGQTWSDLGIELLYAPPPSAVDMAPVTPQVAGLAAAIRASTY